MKRRDLLKLIGMSPLAPVLVNATEKKKEPPINKKLLVSETQIIKFLVEKGFYITEHQTSFDPGLDRKSVV